MKDGTDTREAWITNAAGDLILANGGNDNTPHCYLKMFDGNIMTFATSNTERLRIGSAGQIGLGGANYGSSGQVLTSNGSGSAPTWQTVSGGGSGASVAFKTISVSGQSDVVADTATDTLSLVAGSNMTITTNASGDSITFASSGGGSGISSVAEDTTPQLGGTLDTNGNLIQFGDSSGTTDDRLQFGDDDDMSMYFDGTRLKITPKTSSTTSQLDFEAKDQVYIESLSNGIFLRASGNNVIDMYGGPGGGIYFHHNGNDKLKLEGGNWTTQGDADWTFSGTNYNIVFDASDSALEFADNAKAKFGTGGDLEIYHDGSNSYINDNGTGELIFQRGGSTRMTLASDGVDFNFDVSIRDDYALNIGDGNDLQIYETASDVAINYIGTGILFMRTGGDWKVDKNGSNRIYAHSAGAVDLYYSGSKKLETTSTGVDVTGLLDVSSGARIYGGSVTLDNSASYGDLSYSPQLYFKNNSSSNNFYIWKDGSANLIEAQGSDDLIIRSRDANGDILIQSRTNEYGIKVLDAAAVELYHDNSKKLETTSTGITVTGAIVKSGGTSSQYLMADGSVTTSSGGGVSESLAIAYAIAL